MDSFIGFAGIGSAIIASMGLAMWMEWYCLRWLMRLMPGREAEFTAIEPEDAAVEMAAAAPSAQVTRHEIRLGI